MIVLVGESASGKSSIERELIALGFNKIVTYTTRPMRKEDVDGETYHFITEEQFNDMIEKDLLLNMLLTMVGNMEQPKKIVQMIK